MRIFLMMIIGGLIGILSMEQAVSADTKKLKGMATAIMSAEEPTALTTACKNCTTANCSKSPTLKGSCDESCRGCPPSASAEEEPGAVPEGRPAKHKLPLDTPAEGEVDKSDAAASKEQVNAAFRAIAKAVKSGDEAGLKTACDRNCIAANCKANPKLRSDCETKCQKCQLSKPTPEPKPSKKQKKASKNDDPDIAEPSKTANLGSFNVGNLSHFTNEQRILIRKILGSEGAKKDGLCRTGCSEETYKDDPNFEKFCVANCAAGIGAESKGAAEKLLAASEADKPALCKKECVLELCGDDANLSRVCQSVCGAKFAKACHMKTLSTDLMGLISPKYKTDAQAILDAPDEGKKDKACDSKCSSRACGKDVNFAKFCLANCNRAKILNCSNTLSQEDLESTGAHEDDVVLTVSKDNRKNAVVIEKAAVADKDKATPVLLKACSACTKKACDNDKPFQKFCLDKCPAHTTVECGLTPEILASQEKLFAYYQAVGTARKKVAANQPSENKGKAIPPNNYQELADALDKNCVPLACKKSAKLKALCGSTFKASTGAASNVNTEGLTVLKGTYGFRKPVPLVLPPECQ
jgi:hypothetical protein